MSMVKVNSENIWRLTSRKGRTYYVKCPSKSGAKIFLAEHINRSGGSFKDHAPFAADIILREQIPEGGKLMKAQFRSAVDPMNWKEGNV